MQQNLDFRAAFNGLRLCPLNNLLDFAIKVTEADFGNIQLFDPASRGLRIVTQRGFKGDFLDFFECVQDEDSACGAAMKKNRRVIVPDVTKTPIFVRAGNCDALEVLLAARVRAVYSIPLFNSLGDFIGVISAHYRRPSKPNLDLLRYVETMAQRAVAIAGTPRRKPVRTVRVPATPADNVVPFVPGVPRIAATGD